MSLSSIPAPSFNTLASCAASLCVAEGAFRLCLKNKFMPVFSDDSFPGRAIHQCLDISHYLLGAALVFVQRPQEPLSLKIASAVLRLPVPLVCKAICQRIDSNSPIYRRLDRIAQVARVGIKFAFVVAAFVAFPHIEPGKAQLLGLAQLVGLTMPFVYDALKTAEYLMSRNRDFYLHIK